MTDKEIKAKQALQKRQRLVVKGTCNRLISQFSLRTVRTWEDVYRLVGYNNEYIRAQSNSKSQITIAELRAYCKKMEEDFENKIKAENEQQIQTEVVRPDTTVEPITERTLDDKSRMEESKISNDISMGTTTKSKDTRQEEPEPPSEDYGLVPSPNEKAFLYYFQKKASAEILKKVTKEKKKAVMLIAPPGTGKTFIQGAVDRRLKDMKWAEGKTWGHVPYLAITRNSVVEQTKEVLKEHFNIDPVIETEVINIEKLRTRAGQLWLEEIHTIQDGEEVVIWKWKPFIQPAVIFLDESQSVKNHGSTQHKILTAYSEIPNADTVQIYISATPGVRVSDFKSFAIATKKDISNLGFPPGTILSASTWATYAKAICGESSDPSDYNEAAVDRLMDDLNDYIVRVKGVKWQFNARNTVEVIDFDTEAHRHEYQVAWEKYVARKNALEESVTDNPRFQAMIELGLFLAAAEYAKRDIFASRMYHDVQEGYAAYLAVKFKKTIIAVTKILIEKYGVSRDKIALIWGGGQTQLTEKQKLKLQVQQNKELFEQAGVSLEDMMLDQVEDRTLEDLPAEMRLGNQSKDEREREKRRFQSGQALYCLYTYKAGGVGLSLHHCDERTTRWNTNAPGYETWRKEIDEWNERRKSTPNKQVRPGKVRRKDNGYAYVEDIPYIPTRQRKGTIGPTWSPIDLVQGACRGPRINSLSDTLQNFLYFRGTVEEEQAFVVTHRLKCLSRVVRQHENWCDIIEKHGEASRIARERVQSMEKYETDEPQTEVSDNPLEGEGDDEDYAT